MSSREILDTYSDKHYYITEMNARVAEIVGGLPEFAKARFPRAVKAVRSRAALISSSSDIRYLSNERFSRSSGGMARAVRSSARVSYARPSYGVVRERMPGFVMPSSYEYGVPKQEYGGRSFVTRYPSIAPPRYQPTIPDTYRPFVPSKYPPSMPPKYPPVSPPRYPPSSPPKYPPVRPPKYPPITPPRYPPVTPPQYPPATPPKYPPVTPPITPPRMPPPPRPPKDFDTDFGGMLRRPGRKPTFRKYKYQPSLVAGAFNIRAPKRFRKKRLTGVEVRPFL